MPRADRISKYGP